MEEVPLTFRTILSNKFHYRYAQKEKGNINLLYFRKQVKLTFYKFGIRFNLH